MRAVNLLPREIKSGRRSRFDRRVIAVIGGGVVLAGAFVAVLQAERSTLADRRATLSDLRDQLSLRPHTTAPRPVVHVSSPEAVERLAIVKEVLSRRMAWDRLLRDFALVLPDDVWLSSLKATAPAAAAEGAAAAAAGDSAAGVVIDGSTYSQEAVARLLARLETIPNLVNVRLERSTFQSGRAVAGTPTARSVGFTILADVRGSRGQR